MTIRSLLLVSTMLALAACGTASHRPIYSGHEESTQGVPGFADGKKLSPYVKLGQSYSVDGEWYVPHYQPNYMEEGMASWYGPGFHGGKTANGEEFDTHEFTGAHRTLPLPSIVKVTSLSSGKQIYVRINDRGPFAHSRILDLSHGAADALGMVGKGTDRVRIEYMPQASQKFVDLLARGRKPKSIDLASEVLNQPYVQPIMVAEAKPQPLPIKPVATAANPKDKPSWLNRLSPISTAYAQEIDEPAIAPEPLMDAQEQAGLPDAEESSGVDEITAKDLTAPVVVPSTVKTVVPGKPSMAEAPATTSPTTVVKSEPTVQAPAGLYYIQLGAFLQQANAEQLRVKAARYGSAKIENKAVGENTFYIVRLGPYTTVEESTRVLAQVNALGVNPKLVSK